MLENASCSFRWSSRSMLLSVASRLQQLFCIDKDESMDNLSSYIATVMLFFTSIEEIEQHNN